MAVKENVAVEETEHDRRVHYRQLRAGGKSDLEAREDVWPSTSVGMKKNADDKAKLDAAAAAEKAASS